MADIDCMAAQGSALPSDNKKLPLIGKLLFILPPLFAVAFPLYLGIPALQQYVAMKPRSYVPPGWVRTTGQVVSNQRHGARLFYWDPVVTFQTPTGAVVKFVANADHDNPVPVGTRVPVAYSPRDLFQAEYVNEPGSPRTTALALGIGATTLGCLIAVGIALLARYIYRDDKRHKAAENSS